MAYPRPASAPAYTDYDSTNPIRAAELNWLDQRAREFVSVSDFPGYDPTGATDSYPAFAAAWATLKTRGGCLVIPPGSYTLNSTWVLDVDLALPHNYLISGYGAELLAGAAVTGYALQVYKSFNNFGVTIEGLHFNHRGNGTVSGCIQGLGTNHLRIVNCSVEHHSTKAGYAGIDLGPVTPGDAPYSDTCCFWTLIDGFKPRPRSGADGTYAAVGIRLRGVENATKIMNCAFTGVIDAVRLEVDGGGGTGLSNAVRILHNDFEGVTNAITIATTGATYMPTGLLAECNRVEVVTTFFNITGPLVNDPGYPPILRDNYLTVGSVTNYLVNPNSQRVFSDEPSFYGVGARNYVGGPADYRIVADGAGHNLVVGNASGGSNYTSGHLVLGPYHIWVEAATGKLRIKGGVPASDSDGTVVGTQT